MKKFQYSAISPFVVAAAMTVFLLVVVRVFFVERFDGDARWYAALAEGRIHEVIKPFSGRFLHPLIAGELSRYVGLDLGVSFFITGILSVFLFFLANSIIFKKEFNSLGFFIPLFLLPYFPLALNEIFLPDIFYIFLTALFFLALSYKKETVSLLILFLLFLTRESTILLGLLLVMVSWFCSRKFFAIAALIVIGASLFVTGQISGIGQSDIHGLSGPAYMAFKFVYNFFANVFGAKFWVDTLHACAPIVKVSLPHLKVFGNIHEAGFCGFDFSLPIRTLTALLTIFGIMPVVCLYILRTYRKSIFKNIPFWALIALVYGVAHYFLGIVAGTGVWRIVGYSWPAFLLVTPLFIKKFLRADTRFLVKLSILHIAVAWAPLILPPIASILFALAAYEYTVYIMKS